jgi:hypothetical protein
MTSEGECLWDFCRDSPDRFDEDVQSVFGLVMALLLLGGQAAMAQSTLFNIPSTDTVSRGQVYAGFFRADARYKCFEQAHVCPRAVVGIPVVELRQVRIWLCSTRWCNSILYSTEREVENRTR